MDYQHNEKYSIELKKIDWDFTENHNSKGFSSYHWYPARYVPEIAGILISYFSNPGDKVLDPFSGSGTTLIEAFKLGRYAVGIDINPIATLISQAKLNYFDLESFESYVDEVIHLSKDIFEMANSSSIFKNRQLEIPNYLENSLWYHKETLSELASIWESINRLSESSYYIVGQAAFSSILRFCCSQNKHWGWICDNIKPNEYVYKNAFTKFKSKLQEYSDNANNLIEQAKVLQEHHFSSNEIGVFHGNNSKILSKFSEDEFDLVVTSPPYFNMTDYLRAQRLSFLWFKFGEEMDQLRTQEIGARYKRGRKDAKKNYLLEMEQSFINVHRVLKPDGYLCIVIAESPKHEAYLSQFEEICIKIGFKICDVLTRTISKQRSLTPVIHQEKIYIMQKI